MKKYIYLLLFLTFNFISEDLYSQKFNGFKYVMMLDVPLEDGSIDKYEIQDKLSKFFKKKKLTVIRADEDGEVYSGMPKKGIDNICEVLVMDYRYDLTGKTVGTGQLSVYTINIFVDFFRCSDDLDTASAWFTISGETKGMLHYGKGSAVNSAMKVLTKNIESRMGKYKFDSSRTPTEN